MIIAEWSFDVPIKLLDEFLTYSEKVLKPYWESNGAVSYSAFKCLSKQYFPYQKPNNETRIVEHICFNSIVEFERFLDVPKDNNNAERQIVQRSYEARFKVTNVKFRVYKKM